MRRRVELELPADPHREAGRHRNGQGHGTNGTSDRDGTARSIAVSPSCREVHPSARSVGSSCSWDRCSARSRQRDRHDAGECDAEAEHEQRSRLEFHWGLERGPTVLESGRSEECGLATLEGQRLDPLDEVVACT